MATARQAPLEESAYWEQFFSALSCSTADQAAAWMENEVERYMHQFKMHEGIAWRTIACNLAFFSAYYGAPAVRQMRRLFAVFPECFDSAEYRQEKRRSMNGSGAAATNSPV